VLAKGHHRGAGLPHAEVEALNQLGGRAPGATLYVNLEPCHHYGRTPPCTAGILQSRLKRVVVGMADPNPAVIGGGSRFLRENGLEVTSGVLQAESRRLNEAFVKFVATGRPFVTVKSALTLDGWAATSTGHSQWVSNEKSRRAVHRLREVSDAVLVGVGTVLADNPRLTVRYKRGGGRDPLRVIADTHLRTPLNAAVVEGGPEGRTVIFFGGSPGRAKQESLERKGVRTRKLPCMGESVDLSALLDELGKMSVTSLLVEGGAGVIGSLLRQKIVDKFHIFKAPKLLCGGDGFPMAAGAGALQMDQCLRLKDIRIRRYDDDILIVGYPEYSA
jgi:diaminohydroxyphosphoribosylaminopyrimidine deaminase/5-amino-6-(5-phosphoribosylamino)uracil reductase